MSHDTPVVCPICEKRMDVQGPKEWPEWPFCSPKCKLVDLGRWLRQDYAVPATEPLSDDDEPAE